MTFRELPFDEWPRLVEAGVEPYAQYGLPGSDEHWKIFVAEEEGRIVGCTTLRTEVLWDPWHVLDPAATRGLIRVAHDRLTQLGIDRAYCTIADDQADVRAIAERLGFLKAPGQLYLLDVSKL